MSALAPASALLLDRLPVGVVHHDAEGRILLANPAAARLLGCASPDELVGVPLHSYGQFVHAGSVGQADCIRDDGTRCVVEYESAAIDEADPGAGSIVTFRDVTQRQAVERRKDELISVVSHELRTPLTSIRSVLGLLAGGLVGQLTDRGQSMVHIGITNSDRLIRLVSDLLDLERINAGKMPTRHELVNIGQLMRQAVESVRATATEADVTIQVASVRAQVAGDPDRLVQVLINLLSNAIKFSPAGGGHVWLQAECDAGEVLLRVRDEGRGIPADKLETVFERFARLDEHDERERAKRGTGLGLAISRAIVQQHGGHIWAESTPGAGTTMCVALPLEDVLPLEQQAA